jgi:hypothetical protein
VKGIEFRWNAKAQESLESLKRRAIEALVLPLPDFEKVSKWIAMQVGI